MQIVAGHLHPFSRAGRKRVERSRTGSQDRAQSIDGPSCGSHPSLKHVSVSLLVLISRACRLRILTLSRVPTKRANQSQPNPSPPTLLTPNTPNPTSPHPLTRFHGLSPASGQQSLSRSQPFSFRIIIGLASKPTFQTQLSNPHPAIRNDRVHDHPEYSLQRCPGRSPLEIEPDVASHSRFGSPLALRVGRKEGKREVDDIPDLDSFKARMKGNGMGTGTGG